MQKSKKKAGLVFLIEGFSGSGKSTLSNLLHKKIEKKIGNTIVLSGDNFRKVLNLNKYKKNDRINNSHLFSKLINLLSERNINVIFSIVGLNKKIRSIYKKNIKKFFLIFIDTDINKIIKLKKKKHIYNQKKNIVGIDIKAEYPKNADYTIKNDLTKNFSNQVKKFIKSKELKKFIS
ncbi:adenylyl-sulfate kinase [Candidatus Pelagibacter sp.]|nr:adenylyl-sulfate kinase [Candidatus Pelagibacter sp.]